MDSDVPWMGAAYERAGGDLGQVANRRLVDAWRGTGVQHRVGIQQPGLELTTVGGDPPDLAPVLIQADDGGETPAADQKARSDLRGRLGADRACDQQQPDDAPVEGTDHGDTSQTTRKPTLKTFCQAGYRHRKPEVQRYGRS